MTYGDVNRPAFIALMAIFIISGLAFMFWVIYSGATWVDLNGFGYGLVAITYSLSVIGASILAWYNQKRELEPYKRRDKAMEARWQQICRGH